mmetsp:Transcript_32125/g.92216  ORF Transcript_32125/g.92216 Transcript_32125/m.92216 type:complete len:217 (+) Transcript_32125:647-1297(+)
MGPVRPEHRLGDEEFLRAAHVVAAHPNGFPTDAHVLQRAADKHVHLGVGRDLTRAEDQVSRRGVNCAGCEMANLPHHLRAQLRVGLEERVRRQDRHVDLEVQLHAERLRDQLQQLDVSLLLPPPMLLDGVPDAPIYADLELPRDVLLRKKVMEIQELPPVAAGIDLVLGQRRGQAAHGDRYEHEAEDRDDDGEEPLAHVGGVHLVHAALELGKGPV